VRQALPSSQPFSRGNMMQLPPSPLAPLPEGEGNIVALMRDKWMEKGLSSLSLRERDRG